MTYEMYRYIFWGGLGAAILFLALSVILFIKLNVPRLIGDLTGRNAKRDIEYIRSQNAVSGEIDYKNNAHVAQERLAAHRTPSGNLFHHRGLQKESGSTTERIFGHRATIEAPETEIDQTVILQPETVAQTDFSILYEITYVHTNEVIS